MSRLVEPSDENMDLVAASVRDAGVVVAPSDTNLGLLLDPANDDAIERVYRIKGRDPGKPLTLFIRDPADWRLYGRHANPSTVESVVDAFWPGPLNLVLDATGRVPHDRLLLDGTVSIGCLENDVWRRLMTRLEGPVAMTSANRSGAVPDDDLVGVETALEHVGDAVDYVIDWEPTGATRASTILSLAGEPAILRRGDLSRERVACETDVF